MRLEYVPERHFSILLYINGATGFNLVYSPRFQLHLYWSILQFVRNRHRVSEIDEHQISLVLVPVLVLGKLTDRLHLYQR